MKTQMSETPFQYWSCCLIRNYDQGRLGTVVTCKRENRKVTTQPNIKLGEIILNVRGEGRGEDKRD